MAGIPLLSQLSRSAGGGPAAWDIILEDCWVVWSTNSVYTVLEASESGFSELNNPHIGVTQAC